MKNVLIIVIALFMLSFSNHKTVDEIVESYIETIGGKEKLERITTISIVRELNHLESKRKSKNYSFQKRPNMRRFGSLEAKSFFTTDGEKAWQARKDTITNETLWTELPENRAKSMIRNGLFFTFLGPFINYKEDGIKLELKNNNSENKEEYEIKMIYSDGVEWNCYFDKNTNLVTKIKPNKTTTIEWKDYKKVDDIFVAHTTIGTGDSPRGKFKHINKIIKIEFNQRLSDSLFYKN